MKIQDLKVGQRVLCRKDLGTIIELIGRDKVGIKFDHNTQYKNVFADAYGNSTDFHTIEDLYKFFKMDVKETIEITLEINLEDILRAYKEDISKKLGLSLENIKINLKRG